MVADISSCPLEILHLIAATIDSEDLASLRLVSKQWCDLSSKLFGLAKLQHLRLISSPYSLQSLVDLTAHPLLGPCVQSFEIGIYRLKKHLVNTHPHVEASRANVAALTQFRFQQSGLHIVLLTEALKNLSRHGVVPKIGLFEDVIRAASGQDYYRRGYGYHELYGSIDIASCGGSRATQTLLDLITAGKRSGCPTSGISIDLQWNSLAQQAISRHPGLDQLIEKLTMPDTDRAVPGWNLAVKLTDPCDKNSLRHLNMSATTFHDDSLEDGIDFLTTIKTYLTLQSIIMYKLYFENKHSRILVVDEQVEREGSEQIISAIDDLIGTVNATNVKLGRIGNDEQPLDSQI
ncbi:unnamed protein product, partial [Aureobasidium vineae]